MDDIQDRTSKFALRNIKLSRAVPKSLDGRIIGGQVLRSGTSVGANVEEAEAASTKKDFVYRIMIALRETRETHSWLRLIRDSEMLSAKKMAESLTKQTTSRTFSDQSRPKPDAPSSDDTLSDFFPFFIFLVFH